MQKRNADMVRTKKVTSLQEFYRNLGIREGLEKRNGVRNTFSFLAEERNTRADGPINDYHLRSMSYMGSRLLDYILNMDVGMYQRRRKSKLKEWMHPKNGGTPKTNSNPNSQTTNSSPGGYSSSLVTYPRAKVDQLSKTYLTEVADSYDVFDDKSSWVLKMIQNFEKPQYHVKQSIKVSEFENKQDKYREPVNSTIVPHPLVNHNSLTNSAAPCNSESNCGVLFEMYKCYEELRHLQQERAHTEKKQKFENHHVVQGQDQTVIKSEDFSVSTWNLLYSLQRYKLIH